MHRVLQVPEILLNIFCRCVPSSLNEDDRKSVDADLAALARTCRAFKEPALDILWSELDDPSPLSRCLPEVSRHVRRRKLIARKTAPRVMGSPPKSCYSFTQPLEQAEWDILRGYARRVWCIRDFKTKFDWKFISPSLDSPVVDPLFPNLRSLRCEFTEEIVPLLGMSFPSLIRLDIRFSSEDDFDTYKDSLTTLTKKSPNIKRLGITYEEEELELDGIVSDVICDRSSLQELTCPQIFLDVDALAHLSRMPMLIRLTFMLSDTFLDQISSSFCPSFSNLNYLKVHCESLVAISTLLSLAQLPAITDLTVVVDSCPSKADISSFFVNIQIAGASQIIQELNLGQEMFDNARSLENAPLLDLDDLRPCMAFHNLRRLQLDFEWDVDLSDDKLITLASAWPQLEGLFINMNWGWNRSSGITPGGLAQLLQICPSLTSIALVIDTQGYTQWPARPFRRPFSAATFERPLQIDVLDSVVRRESVVSMAAFFASIAPHFRFHLTGPQVRWSWSDEDDDSRWQDVYVQAQELITKRWLSVLREAALCQS